MSYAEDHDDLEQVSRADEDADHYELTREAMMARYDRNLKLLADPKLWPQFNVLLTCPTCEKQFAKRQAAQKFCSKSCKNHYWNVVRFEPEHHHRGRKEV